MQNDRFVSTTKSDVQLGEELQKMKTTRNPTQNISIDNPMYILILALLNSNRQSFYYLLLRYCIKSGGGPILKMIDSIVKVIPCIQKNEQTVRIKEEPNYDDNLLAEYLQKLKSETSSRSRTKSSQKREQIVDFISQINNVFTSCVSGNSCCQDMKTVIKTLLEKWNELYSVINSFANEIICQIKTILVSYIDQSVKRT